LNKRREAVKVKPLQPLGISQLKILIRQGSSCQLDGAGRYPLQRIIPESSTVGATGHDSFLGTDYLVLIQLASSGAVGAAGLNRCLK